jgi:MFS transporter, putative metabolite transport protein
VARIGAAGGAFLLPIGIDRFGIGPSMLIAATVCAIGLAVT